MEMESNLMNGYMEAYAIACNQLKEKEPQKISMQSGCLYDEQTGRIAVPFLGVCHMVNVADGTVERADSREAVTTTIKVLILHYLLHAKKTLPAGNLISFREVRGGGANYYPTFYKRAILPLQKTFENAPEALPECGQKLGGKKDVYGDASVTIPVFPMTPVTYAVWRGDDEIPASAAILFDGNITNYLLCEDVVLAASFGTYALMKEYRERSKKV